MQQVAMDLVQAMATGETVQVVLNSHSHVQAHIVIQNSIMDLNDTSRTGKSNFPGRWTLLSYLTDA